MFDFCAWEIKRTVLKWCPIVQVTELVSKGVVFGSVSPALK